MRVADRRASADIAPLGPIDPWYSLAAGARVSALPVGAPQLSAHPPGGVYALQVRLIRTEGYNLEAEVEYAGTTLHVMDEFSPPGSSCSPGLIGDVEFSYDTFEGLPWEEMFSGNPDGRQELDHLSGWSYLGYGRIVSVDPVRIDFGILEMEDDLHTHDERCVGEFVRVKIDRLQLARHAA